MIFFKLNYNTKKEQEQINLQWEKIQQEKAKINQAWETLSSEKILNIQEKKEICIFLDKGKEDIEKERRRIKESLAQKIQILKEGIVNALEEEKKKNQEKDKQIQVLYIINSF